MPPRHHYWTIILDGKPTAFRAHTSEELVPTLRQLQARHPDAVMKWFARGRLWTTQEEERADAMAKRRPRSAPASGERRPRDWRPGGDHKDPRDRFKISRDEKRRRFAENLRRDRSGPEDAGPRSDRPSGPDAERRPNRPSGFGRPPRPDRPPRADRPASFDRPASPDRRGKPPWRPRDERGGAATGWKRDAPAGRRTGKPGEDSRSGRPPRPPGATGKPPGSRFKPRGPRPPGGRKPGGGGSQGGGGR